MTAKRTWMAGTSPATTDGDFVSFRGLRGGTIARELDHRQCGADALGGAVLEADHGIDGNVALAAIDRVDDIGVFLVDDAATDFPRAREFPAIGVELLVEQREPG